MLSPNKGSKNFNLVRLEGQQVKVWEVALKIISYITVVIPLFVAMMRIFALSSSGLKIEFIKSGDDLLIANLAKKLTDIDRAKAIVQAYKIHLKPKLSLPSRIRCEKLLLDYAYCLGSKAFNHELISDKLNLNEQGKTAFISFVAAIRYVERAAQTQATATKVKKFVVLYPGFAGGGHKAPAEAIASQLRSLGHEVKLIDTDQLAKNFQPEMCGLKLGQLFSEITLKEGNGFKGGFMQELTRRGNPVEAERKMDPVREELEGFSPDHIFTVAHHMPQYSYLAYRLNTPMTYVHTDYEFCRELEKVVKTQVGSEKPLVRYSRPETMSKEGFFEKRLSCYFSPYTPKQLDKQSVLLEIPVRPSFKSVPNKKQRRIKNALGVPSSAQLCKLAMGKNGNAKDIIEILSHIYKEKDQIKKRLHVIVVCGTNKELVGQLNNYLKKHNFGPMCKVEIKGLLEEKEMAELDQAANVWIVKSGGSTISEAAEMHKQILYVPKYRWEEKNGRVNEEMGLAARYDNKKSILAQILTRTLCARSQPNFVRPDWKMQLQKIIA